MLILHQPDVLDDELIRIWGFGMGSGARKEKEKWSFRTGGLPEYLTHSHLCEVASEAAYSLNIGLGKEPILLAQGF